MSVRVCATVSLAAEAGPALAERARSSLAASAGAVRELERAHAGLHLEGSLGAGDLTWDFEVAGEEALSALRERFASGTALVAEALAREPDVRDAVAALEAWIVVPLASRVARPDVSGIKRSNFVRVRGDAAPEAVAQWCREVPGLAERVPAIRNWSLARVRPLFEDPPRVAWTHLWEQDFETLAGLQEDYMASPYHWGFLDGWYDAEVPKCIMDPDLAHLYCPSTESVLAWTTRNAHARPSVQDVADGLDESPRFLRRRCVDVVGAGLGRMITLGRLFQACHRLRVTEASAERIAR